MTALAEDTLGEAVLAGAPAEELLGRELPATYFAAHILREDENIFGDAPERDVRRTIKVGEVPMPELAPDEVLVGVMASAINYNTIWSAMFAPVPTFRFLERISREGPWDDRHDQPYHVIGSDASGVIVRVGSAVRKWAVGDRVVVHPAWMDGQDPHLQGDGVLAERNRAWGFESNFGGLAHYAIATASQLLPKPTHLTWEESACNMLCGMTAYRMLVSPRAVQFKQGDIVLIWGATGGLGSYAIQLVRNGGGIAVGVVGSERKAELVERLGCDVVVRRDELGLDGLTGAELGKAVGKEIRRHLGEDPHIAFDYIGRQTFGASVFVIRPGGSVVTCGSSTGFMHEYDNRHLWMRAKRVIGSQGSNAQEAWEAARLISQGKIVPALSCVFPLEETGEAARLVQLNRHVGKVGVLCLAPEEGLGIEDQAKREAVGEDRLRLFREFA